MIDRLTVAAAALSLASCTTMIPADGRYLDQFAAAERAGRPFAPVTDERPSMTLSEAYRLQDRIVLKRRRAGDTIAGYKGGLMSDASLKARGVTEPLVGVLFASGRVQDGGVVSLCGYRRGSFEVKLGYVFARRIGADADAGALKSAISAVVPVVDLPDIGYRDPDHYGAVDMVAANVSSTKWVAGRPAAPATADLDTLQAMIARDGRQIAAGVGRESLGGQWSSLGAVVRQIAATGRSVEPGDIVITGKLGDRGWLTPGRYHASYGILGDVAFTVTPCRR